MDKIIKQSDSQQLKVLKLTEELDLEKKYVDSVINSQSNMVISTDGVVLRTINKSFSDFYNIKNINEFIEKFGSCICDTFYKDESSEFIQKRMGEDTWIDYILKSSKDIHKAKIIRDNKEYIFSITADVFNHNDEELKVAVFNDITNLEKATKNLEDTNKKVNELLNNAGQGFLYFNNEMKIGAEYSKEVLNIFSKDVSGLDITKLLYDDEDDQLFLKSTLQGVLIDIPIRQEILISLLKNEFEIDNKFIKVEYKIINETTFMLILTDITSQKELALKIKEEQQVLKMVVEIVTSIEQFSEIRTSYINMILQINEFKELDRLAELRREIHTYKGLFAQKEMLNIVKQLHEFESEIDLSIKQDKLSDVIKDINFNIMNEWLEEDILILKNILGNDFLTKVNHINIDKARIGKLEAKIKYLLSTKKISGDGVNLILNDIEELKYNNVQTLFHPFEKLVEQLSKRLNKNVNPLVLIGKNVYLENKYKPFINSLVHIFRNSLDHGIEEEEIRLETNKPISATINCRVEKAKENIIINIEDDGAGIDIEKIKNIAISKNIYSQEELNKMNEYEILSIIFQDEFSTSDNITDISGRGVGLASIKNELERLNGQVHILNNYGKGLEFLFAIPITCSQNSDIDILEKLSQRTISYYDEYLNNKIDSKINIEEVDYLENLGKSVVIPLTDDMDGSVFMSISNEHANTLIADYIDESMSKVEVEELSENNLEELLNITLGNILKDLEIMKKGGLVGIKTPIIVKDNITKEENSKILISKLKYNNEDIILGYFI